jgi:hypothetical protein
MGTAPFVGTPTVAERLASENVLWKSICKRVAYTLRVGLPGKIVAFDATTQYCVVELQITENIILNEIIQSMPIPNLHDVLLMLPGDSNWCITFPSLIGAECLVMFADMCISAWATNGGVQNQEVTRRHSLSDGFAILAPRSQPNVIPDYSTSAMEIRSIDNTVKLALSSAGIAITSPLLSWNKVPIASSTPASLCIPITLDGVIYYIKLSTTP